MDDEEAKRIQEERDKQLTEEYKELQNPKKPDYNKIINEAGFTPDWDEIDPPMKGQGLVNEALMIGASAGIAAAAKPIVNTIGAAGVIDAGLNIITGESDTAFEKKLEAFRPAKVSVKGLRILRGWLDDIFDKRVDKDYYTTGPLDTLKTAATGGLDVGTARDVGSYSYRKGRGLSNPIWDNLSSKVQKQFSDAGIDSDNATFFIENWNREVGATVEGLPFTDRTFEFMKGQLLPQILEDLKGIDLSDGLQLDHIAQLRAMTPFYKGRNLKQSNKIRRILIQEGIFGGHNPKNLKYLPTDVHTVKTKFWEQQVGKDGSKFFKGRKMRTYADIEKAAKEMKVFINRSNDIVEKVSAQYRFMRKKNITADELESVLEKVDLNYGTYKLKEVRALIKEIDTDALKRSQQGTELLEEAVDTQSAIDSPLPYLTEDNPFPTRTPIKRRTKIKKPKFKKTDKNQTELDL